MFDSALDEPFNKSMDSKPIVPFLKWAGGKRWFVNNHSDLLQNVKYKRYIEPFLGSGAVFFHLKPKQSILSDLNPDLINVYKVLKSDWKRVTKKLMKHQEYHSKEYYYKIRSCKFDSNIEEAAKFIYLNRTCWNGLYRVNKNGCFNVPQGTKTTVVLDTDDFSAVSDLLQRSTLMSGDFEGIVDKAGDGDLVFIDPPYTVCHNNNGFIKYNEKIFSWEDQLRLRDSLLRAKARGAKVVVLNAAHNSVIDLYKNFGAKQILQRKSVLSGLPKYRKTVDEFLVKSW